LGGIRGQGSGVSLREIGFAERSDIRVFKILHFVQDDIPRRYVTQERSNLPPDS